MLDPPMLYESVIGQQLGTCRLGGVGFSAKPSAAKLEQFREHVKSIASMRKNASPPLRWLFSRGWQIPKFNNKSGIPGTRTMHGFSSFSKGFFRATLDRGRKLANLS